MRPPGGARRSSRTARISRETPRRQPIGIGGALARLAGLGVLLWLGGFLSFSLTLPRPAPLATRTDAVVVLTGGPGRLKRGLAVLEAGSARRMLVSGVGHNTTRNQLAAAAGIARGRLKTTDLGYEAIDTRSNAQETARWVERRGYTSIRLVTSAGHMRRAQLELSRVLPATVAVIPDSVPIEPQAPTIAAEFSKYVLRGATLATGAA